MQDSIHFRLLAALLAAVATGVLAGCATNSDLGEEVAEIKAEESPLSFNDPNVAGADAHFFKGRDRSDGRTIYTGSWRPAHSASPSAQLSLVQAPRGSGRANSASLR